MVRGWLGLGARALCVRVDVVVHADVSSHPALFRADSSACAAGQDKL